VAAFRYQKLIHICYFQCFFGMTFGDNYAVSLIGVMNLAANILLHNGNVV
jgi:hypothetical protein